jgi:hypothetical protein
MIEFRSANVVPIVDSIRPRHARFCQFVRYARLVIHVRRLDSHAATRIRMHLHAVHSIAAYPLRVAEHGAVGGLKTVDRARPVRRCRKLIVKQALADEVEAGRAGGGAGIKVTAV